ncbi:unnamed protein product [Ilex paraguariensis]|uniref:Dienelactone hydrolase domain-containing protein n=1 Tax=Ilex paraguariensis TaxID=185542 RepID=A0ABC8SPW5_9AQUA
MVSYSSRIFTRTFPKSTAFGLTRTLSPFSTGSRLNQIRSMSDSTQFKKIQIQRDDNTFDAYVVGKENAPGIVVLQEWWGVDFEVKNHALKISQFDPGYKALIPDLYRGKVGLDVAEAQHLMDGLDWQGAVKDIQASVNWLKANGSQKVGVTGFCMGGALAIASSVLVPGVDAVAAFYGVPSSELADPTHAKAPVQAQFGERDNFVGFSDVKVGVTGFCMGGALAIASSVLVPGVDAVAAFYGVPSSELADPTHAKAPVQAQFGERDNFVGFSDVKTAKAFEEKLKVSGVPYEVCLYPEAGHAFMNKSPEGVKRRKGMGMDDVDDAVVELAWSRFRSWMSRFLSS